MALFKGANCYLCGKSVSKGKMIDLSYVSRRFKTDVERPICNECYENAKKLFNVADIHGRGSNTDFVAKQLTEYKGRVRPYMFSIYEKNKTKQDVTEVLTERIKRADYIYGVYASYSDTLDAACEKIRDEYELLPSNKVDYGLSSFASDETTFYEMPYGNPMVKNTELRNIHDFDNMCDVYNKLKANILDKTDEELIVRIPFDRIDYFQEKGDISYSTDITGGKGGTSNIGYAVIGGLLFGAAGAIVAANTGDEARGEGIQSSTIQHDDRYVALRYRDENGETRERVFEYGMYDVLLKLIPGKSYSYINLGNSPEAESSAPTKGSIPVEELKQLKELLDMGVITAEDFEAKKKQLLGI